MERRRRRTVVATLAAVTVVAVAVAGAVITPTGPLGSRQSRAAQERPVAGDRNELGRAVPFTVSKENGAESERLNGPSQLDYDNRSYPRSYVRYAQTRGAIQAFERVQRQARTLELGGANAWQEVGPTNPFVPAPSTYTLRDTVVSGRITALEIAPSCTPGDCRVWVGAAGGGVWRTDNALASPPVWESIDDGLDTNAIGSLLIDPTDPSGETIYVGTGEPSGSGDSEAGLGLYRSTDGGDHWSVVAGSVPVSKDRSVASIAIDPGDEDHLYIGTAVARHGSSSSNGGRRTPPNAPKLGLYESTDGGASFDLVFSLPDSSEPPATGNDYYQGGVQQMQLDPRDADDIYISVFGYGLWRRSADLEGDEEFHQIFATINPDDFYGDRTDFDLAELPYGDLRIYVGDTSDDLGYAALFRLDDADVAADELTDGVDNPGWQSLSSDEPGDPGFGSWFYCQFQCSYDQFVVSPPGRPDEVWLGGAMNYDEIFGPAPYRSNGRAVIRSTDAGVSWDDMTNDSRSPALGMHPDQHAIVFSPDDPSRVFVGSDGGIVRLRTTQTVDASADCADRGLSGGDLASCEDWLSAIPERIDAINQGLATIQFQSLSVNPDDPYLIMGGTQDNGTWSNQGSNPGGWFESINGDGGQSGFDVGNADTRFHNYYSASPDVNFQGDDPYGWNWIGDPLFNTEPQSFYVPMIADPVNSGSLYAGLSHVWRTLNNGGKQAYLEKHCNWWTGDFARKCGNWKKLGSGPKGDLTSTAYGNSRSGEYVVAVERGMDQRTLWAGTRIGRVFISKNANAADQKKVRYVRLDKPSTPGRFVSGIQVDPADPNHAWISYSGYGAYTPGEPGHVYSVRYDPSTKTAKWFDVSGNLGDQPVLDVVYDAEGGTLYVSSDFGVLMKDGPTWVPAGDGLPTVASYGLTIVPGEVLYAATHGRGAWMLPL